MNAKIWLICTVVAAGVAVASKVEAVAPKLFNLGVISGPAHGGARAFAPGGQTVYFFRGNHQGYDILVSHRAGNDWSAPEIAPFSSRRRDLELAVLPDGSYMIFASSRSFAGGNVELNGSWGGLMYAGMDNNLRRVNRRGDGRACGFGCSGDAATSQATRNPPASAANADVCGTASERALAGQWFKKLNMAWERLDATAAASLFTEKAEYRESPFETPFLGKQAILAYWNRETHAQRDVHTSYEVLSTCGGKNIVHWTASFVRIPAGQKVRLDGIAEFILEKDGKASLFLEWWNLDQQ